MIRMLIYYQQSKNSVTGDSIQRSFEFYDFQEAFLFMSSVAQLAKTNQHRSDWHNLWNTFDITLTTDDKACLSTFGVDSMEYNILVV
jgi:pterin-4a-carbinolamine dehydratase